MKFFVISILLLISTILTAQVNVNSLEELIPYLDDDNVHVKLNPGIYNINASDIISSRYGEYMQPGQHTNLRFVIFPFEGNNSTYDFTDVTINVKTEVMRAKGSVDFNQIRIVGSNNVLLNLTLVDDGSVDDSPTFRAQNIVMDGAHNRIEGFHVTVKGSYPYGYGDSFGKGGGSVIGHKKHSACLVRGESNHVKNCTFIHKSYGHCIFMQAAANPIIEGCYVEGEVRTTDDMLAEEGTGSPADNVDFMTVWGYRLPPGYMLSLGEAGIRAYNAGATIVDGVEYSRGTSNPTILNCTVKNMRTGVTIAHASGSKYVEGCTVLGCENGYSLASGNVVNCSADFIYGPVYASTYENDYKYHADITLLPPSDDYYNGSGNVAYIGGSGHEIILRGLGEDIPDGLSIKVGGDKNNIRLLNGNLPHQNDFAASDFELHNLTDVPVRLSDKSSSVSGQSCGTITDEGANNALTPANCDVACVYEEGVLFVPHSEPGINYYFFEGSYNELPDISELDHVAYGFLDDINITATDTLSEFAVVFKGILEVASEDRYTFYISSDDPSQLKVDGKEVVNYDGTSGLLESSGEICLERGYHSVEISRVEKNSDHTFALSYETPGLTKTTTLDFFGVDFSLISNLAFLANASQSSMAYGGVAARAVDGSTDGLFTSNSVTHTLNQLTPWWQVELRESRPIGQIKIYNRTDACCSDRLGSLVLSIYDEEGDTRLLRTIDSFTGSSMEIDAEGVNGRVIKIQKTESGPMALAEVEIFEGSPQTSGGSFQMANGNSTSFALDGGSFDALEGYSLNLQRISNHENQTWTEIERENGYFAYQKVNTNLCLDGGASMEDGTDLILQTCNEISTGQHWIKVPIGEGFYRLQKKGSRLIISAKEGNPFRANVYLANPKTGDHYQQWRFDLADLDKLDTDVVSLTTKALEDLKVFPNRVIDELQVNIAGLDFNHFELYHIDGRLVFQNRISEQTQMLSIDFRNLKRGMYVLMLRSAKKYEAFKVVK